MAGLNKVMLIGNLGRDPEIRYSQQGLAMVNFPIATSEQWTDKSSGERQEKTEWHRIKVFGKLAETCEKYLSKGRQVYVEGRLQTSSYEKEGQTHYSTEIIVSNLVFLGTRSDGGGGGYTQEGGGMAAPRQPGPPRPTQAASGPERGGMPGEDAGFYPPGGPQGGKGTYPPDDDIPF